MKKMPALIVLVLAVIMSGYLYKKYRVAPSIKFDTLELTNLNGEPVKLQEFKGKKLFLNFYATWCGPCVGEFPSLNQAAEILQKDNFVFISISDEPLALLNNFAARINTPHVIILHSNKKFHDFGVFTYPTNYVINTAGNIVFEKTGERDWSNSQVLEDLKGRTE